MNKYYYQQGRCEANSYLSLNPVLYEQVEDKQYKKIKMVCNCVEKGECDKETSCKLFVDAPEIVEDNGINLNERKL